MIPRSSLLACLLLVLSVVQAVKFQLPSERHPKPKWYVNYPDFDISDKIDRCRSYGDKLIDSIWNFAPKHSLVIVTANSPYEPGQRVDIEILDTEYGGNVYLSKKDIRGETRLAITTHESGDVGVCLTNHYEAGKGQQSREVDLDIEIGADAVDYNAIANQESLSILEVEMRKLEAVTKEIVDELGYLQRREMRMRDTNESTNDRVKTFSILIMVGVVGLGAWQLIHLRSFFKRKYLID